MRVFSTCIFAAACCALSGAALVQSMPFDGHWSVVLQTTVGKCEPEIKGAFIVKSIDIGAAADSAIVADGAVEKSGNMWVRFSAGEDQYRAQGSLRGASGEGAWSSGTRYCGGRWKAVRGK